MVSELEVLQAIEHDDSFTLLRTVSTGAQGRVEIVRSPYSLQEYIRKYIPRELADEKVWRAVKEAHDLRPDCAALPRISEIYSLPDSLVVIMEHIWGTSLEEIVRSGGALVVEDALCIMLDICDALGVLAQAQPLPVIHRDVTPDNIMVVGLGGTASARPLRMGNSGRHAVLIDFGIARFSRQDNAGDAGLPYEMRHDTRVLGTKGFAAPEQYGFAQTDARSDIYAAGCLLGYMITAEEPSTDAYQAVLGNSGLPANVIDLIRKASSFEPSSRYADAREFAEAIREVARQNGYDSVFDRTSGAAFSRTVTPAQTDLNTAVQPGGASPQPVHKPTVPAGKKGSRSPKAPVPGPEVVSFSQEPESKFKHFRSTVFTTPTGERRRLPLLIRIAIIVFAAYWILKIAFMVHNIPEAIMGEGPALEYGYAPFSFEAWAYALYGIIAYGCVLLYSATAIVTSWGLNKTREPFSAIRRWRFCAFVTLACIVIILFIPPF